MTTYCETKVSGGDVAIFRERTSVDQFKLRCAQPPSPILRDQLAVGEFRLRIFVERLHVGMGRRRVEVVVKLFHVLAVIAFRAREAKEPLL